MPHRGGVAGARIGALTTLGRLFGEGHRGPQQPCELREVEHYTKAADQAPMARQGIEAIRERNLANLVSGLPIRGS